MRSHARNILLTILGVALGASLFLASWRDAADVHARDVPRVSARHLPASAPALREPDITPHEDTQCEELTDFSEVAISQACAEGAGYPRCRWQLPEPGPSDGYRIWRNTTPEHRWARPGLVAMLLRVTATFRKAYPDVLLTIGDLDAPGPRHQTHDRGVDVDVYLEDSMIARNDGGGLYPDNYLGKSEEQVASLRHRVMTLGQALALCSHGDLRIYYNDQVVVDEFRHWFAQQGLTTSFSFAMLPHNELHRFHFHVRVAETLVP